MQATTLSLEAAWEKNHQHLTVIQETNEWRLHSADIVRKVVDPLHLQRRRESKRERLERETPEQSDLSRQAINTKTKSRTKGHLANWPLIDQI